MMLTYINNKSSSFHSIGVGYTIWLAMKVPSICCTKCYTTQILINHLTSKVLRINKIKMITHVNSKLFRIQALKSILSLYYTYYNTISETFSH